MDISPIYTCWSIFCWISKGNSYRSPSCFLCADLYSPERCFFFISLNSQLVSLQLKMYVPLHMSSFSVSCPGSSLRAQCAWPVIWSNSSVSCLCWITLFCYLMFNRLKMVISYFYLFSLVVSDGRVNQFPIILSWLEVEIGSVFLFVFLFCICFMFKNIIQRQ